MGDPFRRIVDAERKVDQAMRQPGRQVRSAQQQARNLKQMPQRQARMMKSHAQSIKNLPGQRMRQAKNTYGRPLRGMQRNMQALGGAMPQYKRRPDRMSGTDFSISAMMYPLAWLLTPIAGFIDDWDTAFIKYHLAHARIIGIFAFFFLPIIVVTLLINPLIAIAPIVMLMMVWFYTWFLGFQAYGGGLVIVPFLTNMLIGRGVVDMVTIQNMMGGGQPQEVRPHYDPNARR